MIREITGVLDAIADQEALAAIEALCRGETPEPLPDHPAVWAVADRLKPSILEVMRDIEGAEGLTGRETVWRMWFRQFIRPIVAVGQDRDASRAKLAEEQADHKETGSRLHKALARACGDRDSAQAERDAARAKNAALLKENADFRSDAESMQEERDAARARVAELEVELVRERGAYAATLEACGSATEAWQAERVARAASRAAFLLAEDERSALRAVLRSIPCPRCDGAGGIVDSRCTPPGYTADDGQPSRLACPDCQGTGVHPKAREVLP